MSRSGLVEFGAHTASHAILSRLDPALQQSEILRSVQAVQELTGLECQMFAYPNGKPCDYTDESVEYLRRIGITTAVTSVPLRNVPGTDPLRLGRYGIGSDLSDAGFRSLVHNLGIPLIEWASAAGAACDSVSRMFLRPLRRIHSGLSNWFSSTRLTLQQVAPRPVPFPRPVTTIAFVCAGNASCSPLAERYWNQQLRKRWPGLPEAVSAGTSAVPGLPPSEFVTELGRSFNIELAGHRARALDRSVVDRAGAIFVMDPPTYRQILAAYPVARAKTYMLGLCAGRPAAKVSDPGEVSPDDVGAALQTLVTLVEDLAIQMATQPTLNLGPEKAGCASDT
jgi:protein-tyrosine-phosphatase